MNPVQSPKLARTLPIGTIAKRTGLNVSAIRFYEERGLLKAERNRGGQRRFLRSDIRRLSFVMIAQKLGFTIDEIGQALSGLPQNRTPTKKDWEKLSLNFKLKLDTRIDDLIALRDNLDQCIGCGCLSLTSCKLYNKEDQAAQNGSGPRYLMGNRPKQN